jgi:hypothetical protein
MKAIANFFRNTVNEVRAINQRYATPEVETTLFTKVCLVGLRVYLITMVGIMLYKFISTVSH